MRDGKGLLIYEPATAGCRSGSVAENVEESRSTTGRSNDEKSDYNSSACCRRHGGRVAGCCARICRVADERMKSPNRSVVGDPWCESGSINGLSCTLSVDTQFKLGTRNRADAYRGVGGVWCKARRRVSLYDSGYLSECTSAGTTLNLQKHDGSFAICDDGEEMHFSEDGYYEGRCRRS